MNKEFWLNKRVFITGHSGFKGAWMSLWLEHNGATTKGFSLPPNTTPNLFELLRNKEYMNSEYGDITNYNSILKSMDEFKPEIVFHMAAQPLVRYSYENPRETYSTNVLGTVNVLEASRHIDSIKAIINITTDKCYKNKEWTWGYRENEEMGGFDPYSNSKACSELVTSAYRDSYFKTNKVFLASARAGNVIGGGDWADDRLIPDIFRSIKNNRKLLIRNPYATRPWQHVLEPISGYLKLAQSLYEEGTGFAEAWNFGPNEDDCKSVKDIINYITPKLKRKLDYSLNEDPKLNKLHESQSLRLDISKAKNYLSWYPTWTIDRALDMIIDWHEALDNNINMRTFSIDQINLFEKESKEKNNEKDEIKKKILSLVDDYSKLEFSEKIFVPGETVIPPSGKKIGANELKNMVEASLDGWLTTGRFNTLFEKKLADFIGIDHLITVNSGSSANLVAFNTLTSPRLGEKAIKKGDEVIGVAAGFPTTVNPIVQFGAIPVFVDVDINTHNIDANLIEDAISEKTKAIMLAHTLGNPFNCEKIREICDKYDLWLIEDCCDALGATYKDKMVGTWGDIATLSFYPAHHITMGEGGAVFMKDPLLKLIAESYRDWGRDCYCAPGCDDTCGKRFSQQFGSLPYGYDHKYVYSHLGYNLKITDMQAACGLAQLDSLENFIKKRKENFNYLKARLSTLHDYIDIVTPTENSDPSWFGFPITIKESTGIKRVDLTKYLDQFNIGTRLLFAGNLTNQPYFQNIEYRISGSLVNTDKTMNQTVWLGVQPSLDKPHYDFIANKLEEFFGLNF